MKAIRKFANLLLVKKKAGERFGVDARACEIGVKFGKKLMEFLLTQHPETPSFIDPEFDRRI
jgi:hypothetical protein